MYRMGSNEKNMFSESSPHASSSQDWPDLSFIQTDVHAHFLPGVDDGAKDLETSLILISGMKQMGYEKLIVTPHIKQRSFPNQAGDLKTRFSAWQAALQLHGISMKTILAAEYFLDDHFLQLMENGELLCFNSFSGRGYVLIEFSFHQPPEHAEENIRLILDHAYIPVIAHPERYRYYHQQFYVYESFKTLGCLLQLNLNSLTGYYGTEEQTIALKLLRHGLIDYAGTDMHHVRHLHALKLLQQDPQLMKLLQDYPFQNMYL